MEHIISSVLAQAPPQEILYGYGPLGIGVVALAFALYKLFNVILNDRDKAIQQRDALLEDFFNKVIPALAKNTDVLEDVLLVVRDSTNVLKENTKTMEEFKYVVRSGRGNAQTGGT
jgi:hypothetical protein